VATEAYELPKWTATGHAAALDVINRNSDDSNCIGIADVANVVLADRYRTTQLLTLGQRRFGRLRPLRGAGHFTLLPYDSSRGAAAGPVMACLRTGLRHRGW